VRIERIESKDNSRLVRARKLRDGRQNDSIFIEGRRLAKEAVHSRIPVEECLITDKMVDDDVVTSLLNDGIPIVCMSERLFRTIADTDNPQGIILIARRPAAELSRIALREQPGGIPVVLFLSEINNPSNVGAIFRTAEAAGAAGIILSPGAADPFSPKALRASMGSAFRVPSATNVELGDACRWAREQGMIPTGTGSHADRSYLDVDWKKPRMVVFGSEGHGLSLDEVGLMDETVNIPMSSQVESLNLAVSAGVVLFESRRQVLA
jgi:TrmH family RNA methyltransferase